MKYSVSVVLGAILLVYATWTPIANAATRVEKLTAVQNGLAHLQKTQKPGGYWGDSGSEQAATSSAVYAFVSQQDKWGDNAAVYQATVDHAVAYLLSGPTVTEIGPRSDGVNICPNGEATCKAIYWSGNPRSTEATGITAAALSVIGSKLRPDVVAATRGPLAGMTWGEIAQGIANAIAFGQSKGGGGIIGGGWGSSLSADGHSTGAATSWAVMGLLYTKMLGAVTPDAVEAGLKRWLGSVQSPSKDFCPSPDMGVCDLADTGGWILALRYAGYDLSSSQLRAGLAFLNASWKGNSNPSTEANFGRASTMWSLYMGLETTIGAQDTTFIVNLLSDCGASAGGMQGDAPDSTSCNWSEDYSQWLVTSQRSDGSWSGELSLTDPFAVALYVNILGSTHIPIEAGVCPTGEGHWTSSPGEWPVQSLTLGRQVYQKLEILDLLSDAAGSSSISDASMALARELILAKLNIVSGSDRSPVASAVDNADRLLAESSARLPYFVVPTSPVGKKMTDEVKLLGAYNSGLLTPACIVQNFASPTEPPSQVSTKATPSDSSTSFTWNQPSSAVAIAAGASTDKSDKKEAKKDKLRKWDRKGVTAVAISDDGNLIASASTDKFIRIWDADTGKEKKAVKKSEGLTTGLAFGGGGATLGSVGKDSVIRLWDVSKGKELVSLTGQENGIRAIAISPDGRLLATAGEETRIMLWDIRSQKLIKILYGSTDFVNALTFSPNSRLLACAGEDARVLIFDIASGKTLQTLRGHSGPIDTVAFNSNGQVLASAGQDTTIRLWDPVTGKQNGVLNGHSAPIRTVAFSTDGNTIASGGEDARIVLWNTASGAIESILTGSSDAINGIVFSSKGSSLASASEAGEITIWDLAKRKKDKSIAVPKTK